MPAALEPRRSQNRVYITELRIDGHTEKQPVGLRPADDLDEKSGRIR
jgi:hypothetical protein